MHPVDPVTAPLPPVSSRAALAAAQWLLRLQSGAASAAEIAACERWRASAAEHELAWQRAQQVVRKFGLVPAALGLPVLDRPRRRDRRAAVKQLALLIAAAPLGWAAYEAVPWRGLAADRRTATGERRLLSLDDGTRLHLNTASAVDIRFSERERNVRLLAGEILIDTAADPRAAALGGARPFSVTTAQGSLRALGTRFSVRQYDAACAVAVFDGAVAISPAAAPERGRTLRAGQAARFSAAGVAAPVPADARSVDWSVGVLYAERMRLDVFAAELGRYRPGLLRCDPAVADLTISGAFQLRDTDAVLAALAATLPVQALYRTRYWVTLAPA